MATSASIQCCYIYIAICISVKQVLSHPPCISYLAMYCRNKLATINRIISPMIASHVTVQEGLIIKLTLLVACMTAHHVTYVSESVVKII